MGRKKKKEEPEIYHTPYETTTIRPPEYELSPYMVTPDMIEVTSLQDNIRRYIATSPATSMTYTDSIGEARSVYYPPRYWEPYSTTLDRDYRDYKELLKKLGGEEGLKVNIITKESKHKGEHIVICEDKDDLSTEKILKTLSAAKGKLMIDVAPIHIKKVICYMTPMVRRNVVTASKRLKMYGKKMPIIARFDEYGNRLPDEIEINGSSGMTLIIVNPEDYGELYFELKAVEFPASIYEYSPGSIYTVGSDDLPF